MNKFRNKYRIASARAPFWDYGRHADYFITICTKNRKSWFGEIIRHGDAMPRVSLSKIGEIVKREWLKTFEMRPDMNLWMGDYVVMPNHFHAIIGIGVNNYNTPDATSPPDTKHDNAPEKQKPKNQFAPQSKNLASVIQGFKIGVTKNARQINPGFAWQPRYHDHIIRDVKSYQRISDYIINNPKKWYRDKLNPENKRMN